MAFAAARCAINDSQKFGVQQSQDLEVPIHTPRVGTKMLRP